MGIDARDGKVATKGWAEETDVDATDLAKSFEDAGVAAIIYTDILRDGAMGGPNIDATAALARAVSIPVIASGGVSPRCKTCKPCKATGVIEGAISGRALYDGAIDLTPRPSTTHGSLGLGFIFPIQLRGPHLAPQPLRVSLEKTMLKTRIIPCLDVADGRVVKGVNFVGLRDAGDPVDAAIAYDAAGADELCFLDIHATHENRGTMFDLVRGTAEQCYIPLTVGGGVRTVADVRALLLAGADKVSFNSAAVANPDVIAQAADQFGSQCIVCAIDAKTVSTRQMGDLHPRRPQTHRHRRGGEFARTVTAKGAGEILLTSMDRDGTKAGFNLPLTRAISDAVSPSPSSPRAASARSTIWSKG